MTDLLGATLETVRDGLRTEAHELAVGELVAGKYRIEARLGGGGMAEVWRARHEDLGTRVALKFPRRGAEQAERDALLERFRFEVQVSAQLGARTNGIVAVRDLGQHRGAAFCVMDLVDGASLLDRIESEGALAPEFVADVLDDVAHALDAAHAAGILHRDIKPANVLLPRPRDTGAPTAKARALLADFGVAKAVDTSLALDRARTTADGALVGSPAYMSPEQILGKALGPESDRWSLAVLAYEALTGALPFSPLGSAPQRPVAMRSTARDAVGGGTDADGESQRSGEQPSGGSFAAMLVAICNATPVPMRARRPDLPRSLDAWLQRALGKHATDRFGSATELARAFRRATERRPTSRRGLWLGLCLTGVVAAGAGAVAWRVSAQTPTAPSTASATTAAPPATNDERRPSTPTEAEGFAIHADASDTPSPSAASSTSSPAPILQPAARPSATPSAALLAPPPPSPAHAATSTAAPSSPPPKPYDPSEEQ